MGFSDYVELKVRHTNPRKPDSDGDGIRDPDEPGAGGGQQGQVAVACSQTLSVGANVVGAVASAASGSTICLNNGDYGTVNLWDIARSGL